MRSFWTDRKVLLTGHTGFKGCWLSLWLERLGARVTGLALPPDSKPSFWPLGEAGIRSVLGDIRDQALVRRVVDEADPQIVIHMAAQSLVRRSYRDPVGTYATNVLGTAHLLDACRDRGNLACVLVVTSDKVYSNDGSGVAFSENDRLGGHDPYSSSKACTELVAQSFRDSFFSDSSRVVSARAGNVIGGGDWAQDRLIPDCVRALDAGGPVSLRYPDAVRPWQHVLDPLSGYLALAQAAVGNPEQVPLAVNFGPDPASFRTVRHVVSTFSACFDGKPGWVAAPGSHPPEAGALTLTSEVARRHLGWRPRLDIDTALAWTAEWYRAHRAGEDVVALSLSQIERYESLPADAPTLQL